MAYHDVSTGDLKVAHCNDVSCAGNDESISAPDASGDFNALISPVLVLDSTGNPVIAYYDTIAGDLKVLHCNEPNCVSNDESITVPDSTGSVGSSPSLRLDTSGNPVVSYYDATNHDLKLTHCNDANCSGGDESLTTADSAGDVGQFTALELDAGGDPVISYFDASGGDLKVAHCNDPNCSGNDESLTTPDGAGSPSYLGLFSSLALDASGNPAVSYRDFGNDLVKLLHCNDANCTGGDDSVSEAEALSSITANTALALDAAGNPVMSFYDASTGGGMRLLRCNDTNCTGGDDSVTWRSNCTRPSSDPLRHWRWIQRGIQSWPPEVSFTQT